METTFSINSRLQKSGIERGNRRGIVQITYEPFQPGRWNSIHQDTTQLRVRRRNRANINTEMEHLT